MPFQTVYGVGKEEVARFVEANPLVRGWCQKFSGRGDEWLSGSRRDNARILCRFFKWLRIVKDLSLAPDALLDRQLKCRQSSSVKDRQWLLNLVLEHTRDNPDFKDYSDKTKYCIFTMVKSFCNYHEVPLTMAKGVYGKKKKSRNNRKQISLTQAKAVLGRLSQRDRTILLIMLQSGMEISAVLDKFSYMWHSQVKPQLDFGSQRLKIEFKGRKGSGEPYFTYISQDAIHELQKWLHERQGMVEDLLAEGRTLDKSVVDGEPIFITRFGSQLKPGQFLKQFNRVMKGKVVTHMFRKLFKTEASIPERAVDRNIIEFFMGHITGIDAVGGEYDRTPELHEEIFEKEYAKLEPYINIYSGAHAKKTEEYEKQTKQIESLRKQMDSVMKVLGLVAAGKAQFGIGEANGQKLPIFRLKDKDAVKALDITPETLARTKQKLRELEVAKKRQTQSSR